MKSRFLLIVVLMIFGCSEPIKDTRIELNETYEWELFLPIQWRELVEKERKELTERGEKLANEHGNIETGGFKELLMLNKGDAKLMAAIGQINEKRYGKYEEAREARANYYKSIFDRDITKEVTMDTVSIKLGEITLKNYQIKAKIKEITLLNKEPIINLRIYEGKLNEKEFILISSQSKDDEEDKELQKIVRESKINKIAS